MLRREAQFLDFFCTLEAAGVYNFKRVSVELLSKVEAQKVAQKYRYYIELSV